MKMTSEQVIERLKLDFPFFCAALIKIVTKRGELIPLVFNRAQKKLWRAIDKQERANKPVRIIVVKARQLGVSTLISAYLYWKINVQKNKSAVIVADDISDARGLLNKSQLFLDNMPDYLKAATKYRTKNELYFHSLNSSLEIDTANNANLGRSRTLQYAHLSEVGFFGKNAQKAILALSQAIPNESATAIILESTSNGMDNMFYEEVMRAEEGASDYQVVFLPWYLDKGYVIDKGPKLLLDTQEEKLRDNVRLTQAQLRWRRWAIENNTQGSKELFCQEYPSTLEESFLYTGHPVFPLNLLTGSRMACPPPLLEGEVDVVNERMVPRVKGPLKIWKYPEPKRAYSIGVDVAEGITGKGLDRDYSVLQVVDALTLEQVAEYRERTPTDIFAHVVNLVGKLYNKAYVTVERNGPGLAVLNKLRDLRYFKLYKEHIHSQVDDTRTETLGLRMKGNNKPMIVNNFVELFRDEQLTLNSPVLIDEMSKFSVNTKGRMRATIGHDDTVMAFSIALWGLRYTPLQSAVKAAVPAPPIRRMTFIEAQLELEDRNSNDVWMRNNFPGSRREQ